MMKITSMFCLLLFFQLYLLSQDTLNKQNSVGLELFYEEYRANINIGSVCIMEQEGSEEVLIERFLEDLEDYKIHSGPFRLLKSADQAYKSIVFFIEYKPSNMNNKIISGFILNPLDEITYQLWDIGEWMDGCPRGINVKSVFTQQNHLYVLLLEDCYMEGVINRVFKYDNRVLEGKLHLKDTKSEHCGYWYKDGDYVYPRGGESTEDAEFIDCNLNSYEAIIKEM